MAHLRQPGKVLREEATSLSQEIETKLRTEASKQGVILGRIEPVGSARRNYDKLNVELRDLDVLVEVCAISEHTHELREGWVSREIPLAIQRQEVVKHIMERHDSLLRSFHETVGASLDCEGKAILTNYATLISLPSSQGRIQVDLFPTTSDLWSSSLLYWTGSRHFNNLLRSVAARQNVSYHHLWIIDHDEKIPWVAESEIDILERLGMEDFADPAIRSNKKLIHRTLSAMLREFRRLI